MPQVNYFLCFVVSHNLPPRPSTTTSSRSSRPSLIPFSSQSLSARINNCISHPLTQARTKDPVWHNTLDKHGNERTYRASGQRGPTHTKPHPTHRGVNNPFGTALGSRSSSKAKKTHPPQKNERKDQPRPNVITTVPTRMPLASSKSPPKPPFPDPPKSEISPSNPARKPTDDDDSSSDQERTRLQWDATITGPTKTLRAAVGREKGP